MKKIADVSHHQGDIDWSKASNELDLAIIRVQYGSSSIDKKLKQNIDGCKKHGLPFGHYAYALFVSVNDAEKEAKDFLSRIDENAKFLVVDVEEITVRDTKDLIPATQKFIDTCKKAGYKIGLYCGEFFFKHYGLSAINADFLWVAKYAKNEPNVPYHIWQNTDSGNVDGIKGKVDLNLLTGSKSLDWFIGKDEVVVPQPIISVKPVIGKVKVIADGLNIRQSHDINSPIVRVAKKGEVFNVYANVNDWHQVNNGWVFGNNGKYLSLIKEETKPAYPNVLIKEGSKGEYVKMVQRVVGATPDGDFGLITKSKVKTWQSKHGLSPDGIVGKNTWSKMF
jgi:GH25 family lysozyme M1 (1,4-beta-N-acetylmuramidase)